MHHFVISAHCMATFFGLKRDVAANLADGVGMDVQERGDVLQVEQINDAGAALHQQVVALAGRGAVEVEIARTELTEDVLGNDGTQLHRLLALVEKLLQLLTRDPDYAAGHHRLDGGLRRTAVEERGVIDHKLALEREPRDVRPVDSRPAVAYP